MTINENDIVQYLRDHPDFFDRHQDILLELKLSHPSGQAVSLLERQMSVMRGRNVELRHRLSNLLDNARDNDSIFEKTKRLTLALLDCNELGDLVDALYYSLDKEFGIPHSRLILFSENPLGSSAAKVTPLERAKLGLGQHLQHARPVVGGLAQQEIAFLFDHDAEQLGSAAIAILRTEQPFGVLAIGNPDPERYRANMGTLFLSYIADVLNRLLPPHLKSPQQAR